MGTVVAEVAVVPIGTASTAIGDYIEDVINQLKHEGKVKYQVNAMSTVLEGELDDVIQVIRHMHEVPFKDGAKRVLTDVRIDDRRDKPESMEHKVERALGKEEATLIK